MKRALLMLFNVLCLWSASARADIVLTGSLHLGDDDDSFYTPRDPISPSQIQSDPLHFSLSSGLTLTGLTVQGLRDLDSSLSVTITGPGVNQTYTGGSGSASITVSPALALGSGDYTLAIWACPTSCWYIDDVDLDGITLVTSGSSDSLSFIERVHVGDSNDNDDDYDYGSFPMYPDAPQGMSRSTSFTVGAPAILSQIRLYKLRHVDSTPISYLDIDGKRLRYLQANGTLTYSDGIVLTAASHNLTLGSLITSGDDDDFSLDDRVLRVQALPSNTCAVNFTTGLGAHGAGGAIVLGNSSTITGNPGGTLMTTSVTAGSGVSCSSQTCAASGTAATAIALPSFQTSASTTDTSLGNGASLSLAAGSYRNVSMGKDATLSFTSTGGTYKLASLTVGKDSVINLVAGDYWIGSLSLSQNTVINVSGGTARLFVNSATTLPKDLYLNQPGTADELAFVVYGSLNTGNNFQANAFIYASGAVTLGNAARINGALAGSSVIVGNSAVIDYQAETMLNMNFGNVCTVAPSVDHFHLSHDGYGIHCLAEPVTVTAHDAGHNAVTAYTGGISLNTGTGKGTWSLLTGGGTFSDPTANDGLASHTFSGSDNGQAQFNLSYPEGSPTVNVTVCESDGSPCDDNSEGNLVFAPSGFTVTASALSNPPPSPINDPIATQTAGSTFTTHIAAYGQTPTDPLCGIIEGYTGNKPLKFWVGYDDPTTGTLAPTVNGTVIAASEAASTNQTVSFANGQASVSVKYKDVGRIQLQLKDDDIASHPNVIQGGSNAFVVKPAELAILEIVRASDGAANPGAVDVNGAVFLAAGEAIGVTVEARDAEGSRTPNYGRETAPEGLLLGHTLVQPGGGSSGALSNAGSFSTTLRDGSTLAGRFYNGSLSFNEVGIISLQAQIGDGDYLLTGNVLGSASGNVGRFTPHHFRVSNTSLTPGCTASFSYQGQSYSTAFQLTAENLADGTTSNYTGSFAKLTPSAGTLNFRAIDRNGVSAIMTPLTARLSVLSASGSFSNGIANNISASLRLNRLLAGDGVTSIPDGPWLFFGTGTTPTDSDGVTLVASQRNLDADNDGSAEGLLLAEQVQRYGRLRLSPATGSELLALGLPMLVEYYAPVVTGGSSGFLTSSDDSCTTLTLAPAGPPTWGNVTLGSYTNSLASGETAPTGSVTLSSGTGTLTLSAPGAGNQGSVLVTVNAPVWLDYNWNAATAGDENPSARATFGLFRGRRPLIYWRETYR